MPITRLGKLGARLGKLGAKVGKGKLGARLGSRMRITIDEITIGEIGGNAEGQKARR